MKLRPALPLALLCATPLLLSACARVNDMTMNLLASEVPAYAVVGDRLLSGQAKLYADRSGTLTLQAAGTSCMASMRYGGTSHGTMLLRCDDGAQATLTFRALSETSGHARSAGGEVTLAYGLDPEPARAWLTPPAGRRLVPGGDALRLE